jgi:hypothetical protein
MKTIKMFSIDVELIAKLQKCDNMSAVVNEALWNYFKKEDVENMTPEQARKKLAVLQAEKRYLDELEKLQ